MSEVDQDFIEEASKVKALLSTRAHVDWLREREKSIKDALVEKIRALPDNPDIERLRENCFQITSSNCFSGQVINLSPFYHDWKAQHNQIIKWIEQANPLEKALILIGMIIKKGSVRTVDGNFQFHPGVIEQLRGLQ